MIKIFLKTVAREGLFIAFRKTFRLIPVLARQYRLRLPIFFTFLRLKAYKVFLHRSKDRTIKLHGFTIHYHDLRSLYMEYKDIFYKGIYSFIPVGTTKSPNIIDGGGFIGLSLIYFKYLYPDARITIFEPSAGALSFLRKNIKENLFDNVRVIEKGLSSNEGTLSFSKSATDAGKINPNGDLTIPVTRLSSYITNTVNFLKLNIEGAELDVLQDLNDTQTFSFIDQMVIEWHSFKGEGQNLDELLRILKKNNYHYIINHFDYVTNRAVKPPFHVTNKTQYYLLVYAKRKDLIN